MQVRLSSPYATQKRTSPERETDSPYGARYAGKAIAAASCRKPGTYWRPITSPGALQRLVSSFAHVLHTVESHNPLQTFASCGVHSDAVRSLLAWSSTTSVTMSNSSSLTAQACVGMERILPTSFLLHVRRLSLHLVHLSLHRGHARILHRCSPKAVHQLDDWCPRSLGF